MFELAIYWPLRPIILVFIFTEPVNNTMMLKCNGWKWSIHSDCASDFSSKCKYLLISCSWLEWKNKKYTAAFSDLLVPAPIQHDLHSKHSFNCSWLYVRLSDRALASADEMLINSQSTKQRERKTKESAKQSFFCSFFSQTALWQ